MRSTIQLGSRGVDVVDWQGEYLGCTADGVFGPNTDRLTKEWQRSHGLDPDGIVGPNTWATAEPGASERPIMVTIAHVKGIERLTVSELRSLVSAANWIGIDPSWLAAVISFETGGTFSPAEVNKAGSGATGVIQFMPDTAARLLANRWPPKAGDPNPTRDEKADAQRRFAAMSFATQLEYVKRYFAGWRGKLKSLEDTYLVVFYPAAIGRSAGDVIASIGSKVYEQNAGFDHDGKGYITRGDITGSIAGVLVRAIKSAPPIIVPLMGTGAALMTGAAAYGIFKLYQLRKL